MKGVSGVYHPSKIVAEYKSFQTFSQLILDNEDMDCVRQTGSRKTLGSSEGKHNFLLHPVKPILVLEKKK